MRVKLIVVGDMHVTPESLSDCDKVIDGIVAAVKQERPDKVVFLGDQHHTHGLVRVEVIDWWQRAFEHIREAFSSIPVTEYPVVALVGNHDKPGGEDIGPNAMLPYHNVVVVDRPTVHPDILFMPHMNDKDAFVGACNEYPHQKVLICHQTFDGSQYDNGFYASDGVDADKLPQKTIISGHIHTEAHVGKVWYPGSPRWMTLGDANVKKAFYTVTIEDGVIVDTVRHGTENLCRRIESFVETPDFLRDSGITPDCVDYVVDLRGPSPWIEERLKVWNGKARVRTFPVDASAPKIKESEGVNKAFGKYLESFEPKFGTDKALLATMARERCGM